MSQHQAMSNRFEDAPPPHGRREQEGRGSIPPGCVGLPEAIAQGAYAMMIGLMQGKVPLKVARAGHGLGELSLRGVIVAAEYGTGQALQLPDASSGMLDKTPESARGS